jgi:hypothetical protein
MFRVRLSSQAFKTQTVWLLLLPLQKSRQEATCKNLIQFSAQFPRGFNFNIIMERNLKTYGHLCMLWHSKILALKRRRWPGSRTGSFNPSIN